MSNVAGTIELLSGELARVFDPLARRLEDNSAGSLLEWLGLRPPDAVASATDVAGALASGVSAAADLVRLIHELTEAVARADAAAVASASTSLLERIANVIQASRTVATALQSLSAAAPGLTPPQRAELAAFAGTFVDRLLNRLMVEYLEERYPQLAIVLIATGGIEIVEQTGGPVGSLTGAYTRKTFHFDRLVKLLTDPAGLLRDVSGWGQPGFDGLQLFRRLQTLLGRKFEIPAQLLEPPGAPRILEAFGFSAEVNDSVSPPGVDVTLRFPGSMTRSETINAGDWQITVAAQASFAADIAATIRPLFDVEVNLPTGTADFRLVADFARSRTAAPFLVLGTARGSRLEVQSLGAGVQLDLHFDSAARRVALDPEFKSALRGGKVVISGNGGDSFITQLLSGVNLESNFDAELRWSPSRGLVFLGSAALEIMLPTHVSLGPLEILALYLRAALRNDGSVPVELSGRFKAALGPLTASVDRLGLIATFTCPNGGGNLGPANVGFAFKPPNGVGLSVDAGLVKGGGYLFIDADRGEYAGALELVLGGFLTLRAVGLISTRMPDGSPGFSLLIIITAEFGNGLQLGFGFTLLAVGGLLGLNRTLRLQPLVEGVRTGAVNSVMFPRDVVANAPRIISDLRALFPPEEGKFLIGPMAKLGWGTPTLVSLSLGIIIEVPGNAVILGVLRVALPADRAAVIVLQVNFAGVLEFDRKRFYFFASLFDSRVVFLTIEGEMGVLAAFGDDANFVLTVGGFHPRFTPPPLPFPAPRRITVNVLNLPVARIRVEGYFAVTTNTAQFGAAAETFFGFSGFSVEGRQSFDALLQFSPLYFIVEASAEYSIRVFGMGVFGIHVRLTLEGPTPWHARGTGRISFFFFSITVSLDITWGEARDTTLPSIAVMPLLAAELDKQENWRAQLPAGANLLVALRKLAPTETALVLHPVGTLRVSQKAVPLDLTISRVGSQRPADANRFSLGVAPDGLVKRADVTESFAPAQFQDFDDAAKLSRPAFEPGRGGVELSVLGEQLFSGTTVKRSVRYDLITFDTNYRRFQRRFHLFTASLFTHLLGGASVTYSALSQSEKSKLDPFADKVRAGPDTYAVALQSTNQALRAEAAAFPSEAAARDYLRQQLAGEPALAGTLHVIPQYEVAA